MISGEDESSSVLNGRLRPRKSAATLLNPPNTSIPKHEHKVAQDKPKRNSTPSKASPNKQDDLTAKADSPASPVAQLLCPYCERKFTTKLAASKHARRIHLSTSKQDSFISCLFCTHSAAGSNDIIQHMVDNHPNQYFACLDCHSRFTSTAELAAHKLNLCEKQKQAYRSKLRQKTSPLSKKAQKKVNTEDKSQSEETEETKQEPEFNGLVISCELKPSQSSEEVDIEDKITTNLILPSNKTLANSVLQKNAVIILDDIQWKKRIPPNFSFHNADADQILSRLGVVHRSPRVGESTRREWLKMIDDTNQKFEKCFDTNFYARVASNVHENLARFVDGTFNFSPDPDKVIKTRKSKSSAIINTAEGFPILLPHEQFSRNSFDGYMPRAIAPKHKWKWDSTENEKHIIIDTNVMKRDNHVNQCIITLVSSLDIWTQLRMRRKFEGIYCKAPTEKMEKQNIIGRELKEILESREIPCSSSQVVEYTSKDEVAVSDASDFPSLLGLSARTCAHTDPAPAVLSGEWVRPRCHVCCACGEQTRDARALTAHMASRHPNAQVQHYDIVGESLLNAEILKHLYVPPSHMPNRTRPLRGFRECTKCTKSITLEDLHQHMLDCAGDTPTVRRKVRSRPFGVRRRRPRPPDNNTIRKKIRKDIRTRHNQKALLRARPRIRTEVGDAETIRKMLADLPAKRHRQAAGHPTHHVLRPRRKIEKQRSKLKIKRLTPDDANTRKARSKSDTQNPSQLDDDDQPLKRSVKVASEKTIPAKKRFSSRLSKNIKKTISDKTATTIDDVQQNASGSSSATQPQQLSSDSQKLNVNGGSNDRGEANNERSKNDKSDDHAEQPSEDPYKDNQNDPAADPAVLKHSINSITASSDSQLLPQQNPVPQQKNADGTTHADTQNILANEIAATKPDKPPLSSNQKRYSKKIQRPLHLKLQSLSNCIEKIAKSKKQTTKSTMFSHGFTLKDHQNHFQMTSLPLLDPNPAVVCSSRDESGTVVNVTPAKILSRQTILPPTYDQYQMVENDRQCGIYSETESQRQPIETYILPPRADSTQRKSSDSEFAPPRLKASSGGRRRKSSGTRASLTYNDYEQASMAAKLVQQPHPYGLFPNLDPHSYMRAMEQNIRRPSVECFTNPDLFQFQYKEMQDIIKNSHLHCLPPLNVGFSALGPYSSDVLYDDRRANVTRHNIETASQLMYNAALHKPVLSPTSPLLNTDGTLIQKLNNNYSVSSLLPTELSPASSNNSASRQSSQKRVSESSETDVYGHSPANLNEAMKFLPEPRSTPDMRRRSSESATLMYKPPSSPSIVNTSKHTKSLKELSNRMNGSDFVTISQDSYGRHFETASNASDVSGSSSKTLQDQVENFQINPVYHTPNSVQEHRSVLYSKEKSHEAHHQRKINAIEGSQHVVVTSNINKTINEKQWHTNTSSPLSVFPTITLPAKKVSSSSTNQIRNSIGHAPYDSTYTLPDEVYREQNYQDTTRDPRDTEAIEQPLDLSGKKITSLCNVNVHTEDNKDNDNSDTDSPELSGETFVTLDLSNKNREYIPIRGNSNESDSKIHRQPLDAKEQRPVQMDSDIEQESRKQLKTSTDLSLKDKLNNIPSMDSEIIKNVEQHIPCPNETNGIDAVSVPHDTNINSKLGIEISPNSGLIKTQQQSRRPRYKSESDIHFEKTYYRAVSPSTTVNQNNFSSNVNLDRMDNIDTITSPERENTSLLLTTKPSAEFYDSPQMNKDNSHYESGKNSRHKVVNSERNIITKDLQIQPWECNNDNKIVTFEDKTAYAREILIILFNHDPDIEKKTVTLPKELVELLYIVPRDQILKYLRVIPTYLEHIMTENTPLMNGQDITRTMKLIVDKLFEFLNQLYIINNDKVTPFTYMQNIQDIKQTVEISAALKILAYLEQLVMTKHEDINTSLITVQDPQNITQPVEELLAAKILSFLRKLILIKKYPVKTPLIKVSPAVESNKKPACHIVANSNENRLTINTVPYSSILPKKRHSPSARLNSQEAYFTTQSRPLVNTQQELSITIPSMSDNDNHTHPSVVRNDIENFITAPVISPELNECDSKENISKIIDLTDDDYYASTNQTITNTGQELVPKLQALTKNASEKTASLRAVRIKSPWSRKSISDDKQLLTANNDIDNLHSTFDLIHTDRHVTLTSNFELSNRSCTIDTTDSNIHQHNKFLEQSPVPVSKTKETVNQIEKKTSSFKSPYYKDKLEQSLTTDDKTHNDQMEMKRLSSEKTISPVINVIAPMREREEVLLVKKNISENISECNSFKEINKSLVEFAVENSKNSHLYESRSNSPQSMSNKENNTTVKTSMFTNTQVCKGNDAEGIENYQKHPVDGSNDTETTIIDKPKSISCVQLNEDIGIQRDICKTKQPKTKYSENEDSDDDISLAIIVKQRQQDYTASPIETKISTKSNSKKDKKHKKKSNKTYKNLSSESNSELVTINATLNNIVNKEEPMVVDLHNIEVGKNVDRHSKLFKNVDDSIVSPDVKVNHDVTIHKENSIPDISNKSIGLDNIYDSRISNENKICENKNKTDENSKGDTECNINKNTSQTGYINYTSEKTRNDTKAKALKITEIVIFEAKSLSNTSQDITAPQVEGMTSYQSRKENKFKHPEKSLELTCEKVDAVKSQSISSDGICLNVTQTTRTELLSEPGKNLLFLDDKTSNDVTLKVSLELESKHTEIVKPPLISDLSADVLESNKKAVRRSGRRGKSVSANEQHSIEDSTHNAEIVQKTPFTKKQLIFSKYLMDENHHSENDTYLPPNAHNDNELTSTRCIESKKMESTKRKKSLIAKNRSKKNKSAAHLDEMETISNCTISKDADNVDKPETTKAETCKPDFNSVATEKEGFFEFEDDGKKFHMTTKEKRKLNVDTTHDAGDLNKAKSKEGMSIFEMTKSRNSSVNNVEENSLTQDYNGIINHDEKPSICSEIRTACYNRPIISKQMSLSDAVPVKNYENYDPYDINLEVMTEYSQPVLKRKGSKFSNNKASKITKKCSTTEKSGDTIQKELEFDEPKGQAVESAPPSISDSESSVSDVPLQKYVKEKEKMKSNDLKIPNIPEKYLKGYEPAEQRLTGPEDMNELCTKNVCSHINNKHGGQIHASDALVKDLSQITKLIDTEKSDKNYPNTMGKNNITGEPNHYPNQNEDAEAETSTVKPNIKQKRNRRSLTSEKTEIVCLESDQQLSSDKYMENFGFYSVRKPRKSNLLASKKISETFHMIESDDIFFCSKSRQRKSSHSENRKAPYSDSASKATQDITTTNTEKANVTETAATPTPQIEVEESSAVVEPINYDGEVDLATAQQMLDSEEIRRLENELIVGFKQAAEANAGKTSGFNYLRAEEPISSDHVIQDNIPISAANHALEERIEGPECAKKPNKNKHKTPRPPEYKEMMYPDEEVNIYEDKYDIIKRRRTQAAAAKQLQNVDEPRTITKAKKKSERKSSHKKCPKKSTYSVSQVPTKGALKGFDGIKISIPTQDLNMPPNVSPPHDQQRHGRTNKKRKNGIHKSRDRKVSGSSSKSEGDTIKYDGGLPKRDIYEFEDDERPAPQAYRLAKVFDKRRHTSSDIEEKDQEMEVEVNRTKQCVKEQTKRNVHDDEIEQPKAKKVKRKGTSKRKCNDDDNNGGKPGTSTEEGKRSRKDDKYMYKDTLSYGMKPEKKLSHEYNKTNLEDSDIEYQMIPGTRNFVFRDDGESSFESDSSAPAPLIGRNFDGTCPCTCASPTEIESDDSEIERGCANSACRYNPDSGAKSLVMGKIFKHNAVRCDKSDDLPQDPPSPKPKPDLDLLFDSLLEQNNDNTTPSTNKPTSPVPGPSSSKYNSENDQKHPHIRTPEISNEKDMSHVDDGFSSPNQYENDQISRTRNERDDVTSPHDRKPTKTADDVYKFVENTDNLSDGDRYIKKSKKHIQTEESGKKKGASQDPIKTSRLHENPKKSKSHSKHKNKDKALSEPYGSPREVPHININDSVGIQSKRSRSDVEISSNDDEFNTVKSKKSRKSGKKHKSHHKRNKGSGDEKKQRHSSDDTAAPRKKNRRRSNNEDHYEDLDEEKVSSGKRPPSRKSDEGISTSHDNSADAYDVASPEDSGVAVQRARRKCAVGKQNVLTEHWSSSESEASVPHGADSRRKGRKHSAGKKSGRVGKKRHSEGATRSGPQPKIRARATAREPDYESDGECERDKKKQEQHGWIVGGSHKKLVTLLVTSKSRHGEERE